MKKQIIRHAHPAPSRWRTCAAMAMGWALAAPIQAGALPTPAQVQAEYRSSETLILDRHGEVLHRLRSDAQGRRGPWTRLADISPAMRTALVFSEDRDFYAHSGVDWSAVSAAAWGNLWHTRTRGASTITMQLAGLLGDELQAQGGRRSLGQKINQAWVARQLEKTWRKDQILEAYLNRVPFRGELAGIAALAQSMFAKAPSGLDAREAAIATALVRGPNAAPAVVARRACQIWQATQANAAVPDAPRKTEPPDDGCEAIAMLTAAALRRQAFAPSEGLAPHLAVKLVQAARAAQPGQPVPARIATTLDARLQAQAEIRSRNVEDGAAVVLDNRTGEVLAWVGSSGELSQAGEVDGVSARRQPGSALKPFLYAQAIAERRLTAASLLEDSPTQIVTPTGLYAPNNYDGQYQGWVSVRTALASSVNIPAVRTLAMVGPDAFAATLNALGLRLAHGGGHYGLSLALGSPDVSLLDLANAYRTLANGGAYSKPTYQPVSANTLSDTKGDKQILDAGSTFIVGDILSDPIARAPTFGTASVLATRSWTAVKTGTSKDMRDNWALGWSDRYTVGVWVGNASGQAMWNVSGVSGAAPVWADLMQWLHREHPSRAPQPPAGVVRMAVHYGPSSLQVGAPPIEAPRQEWFVRGTEQAQFTVPGDWLASARNDGTEPVQQAASVSRTPARRTPALRGPQPRQAGATPATQPVPPAWWSPAMTVQSPATATRITAPANGTMLALDPDIPPANQRLQLRSDATPAASRSLQWFVGEVPLARGATAQWMPMPGRFTLALKDGQGRQLDAVRIEVRGAGLAEPVAKRRP
jgi:penicillin-binding protein 1C